MSNDASSVLAQARKDIGYWRHDDPKQGTKFGRWYAEDHGSYYGTNGVPYCAMAVSYWFAMAGAKCAGLPEAYCPYILNDAKKAGAVLADKKKAQPGDVVLFDWDGGVVDHVGIVEKNCGSYIQTIEGNTTYNGKSESVGRRTRAWSTVKAVVRPSWGGGGSSKPSSGGSSKPKWQTAYGDPEWFGPKMAKAWQRQLGTVADGVISGQPTSNKEFFWAVSGGVTYGSSGSDAVLALQRGLKAAGYDPNGLDRYYGKGCIKAHQRWLKAEGYYAGEIDGYHGHETNKAMCRALAAGAYKKL